MKSITQNPAEAYALTLFGVLQKADPSVEIALHPTCFGQTFYEWWIDDECGFTTTFVDAVHEIFLQKMQNSEQA